MVSQVFSQPQSFTAVSDLAVSLLCWCVSDETSSKVITGVVVGIIGIALGIVVGVVLGLKARSGNSGSAPNSVNKGESDAASQFFHRIHQHNTSSETFSRLLVLNVYFLSLRIRTMFICQI